MASLQCNKPAEHSQHQKHDQNEHCFGHMSDKIKGVFKGHHHGHAQAPAVAHHSANATCGQCTPALKKKEHKNKEGFFHKIKEAFSDRSSDDSSDSDNEGHKGHHKRKN